MKSRNQLLGEIVIASGGTITGNTRNGLLRDWLDSVSTVTRFAPKFDGVSTYFKLDTAVTLETDWHLSVQLKDVTLSKNISLFGNSHEATSNIELSTDGSITVRTSTGSARATATGVIQAGSSPFISVTAVSGVVAIYVDGVDFGGGAISGAIEIEYLGRYASGSFNFVDCIYYNADVNGQMFKLDNPFSDYPSFEGLTAYNFVEPDIVEIQL